MYKVIAGFIRALYALMHRIFPTKKRIVFMSRQSDSASLDFLLLKGYCARVMPDWLVAESYHLKQSVPRIIKDVFLVATSRACILDGYNPAVSIPTIDSKLVVIQLWHAFGALKKFGWQSTGTAVGRSKEMATELRMHNNYSHIIVSGSGCVATFAEAFCCSEDTMKVLGLPKMDYVLDNDKALALASECAEIAIACRLDKHARIRKEHPELSSGKINVLYVPTLRGNDDKPSDGKEIQACVELLSAVLSNKKYNLIVNKHPVDSTASAASKKSAAARNVAAKRAATKSTHFSHKDAATLGTENPFIRHSSVYDIPHTSSIDLLELADYVVTDYSAIVFEAALLKKKVLFFVPDIEEYRLSPGLAIDVEEYFPAVSFRKAADLAAYIEHDTRGERSTEIYESCGFWSFCDAYMIDQPKDTTNRVGDFIRSLLN